TDSTGTSRRDARRIGDFPLRRAAFPDPGPQRPATARARRACQHVRHRQAPSNASPDIASWSRDGTMTPRFACPLLLALLLLLPASAPPLHAAPAPPPRLMLATGYHDGIDATRYWVSEKLDGVRGRWDGRVLWTRGGHRIHAPAWFTAGWPAVPMDGELWLG